MYNNGRSVTRNGNKGGQNQVGPQSVPSRQGMGREPLHASSVGAREERTERIRPETSALHPGRSQGGQASLSLYGIAGCGRARWADAHREAAKAAAAQAAKDKAPSPTPDRVAVPAAGVALAMPQCWQQPVPTPKLSPEATVAALEQLSPEQANRLVGALQGMVQTTPAFHARIVEALALIDAPVAVQPVAPRPRLSRECLSVFATVATVEQRPVVEVIEECLADMAAHLTRTRHALHLDAEDTAALHAYLDSVERSEREEDEASARLRTTPAMRQAAAAADECERHPKPDLEEWDRTLPFGAVELALAID